MKKNEAALAMLGLIIGAPLFFIQKATEIIGGYAIAFVLILLGVLILVYRQYKVSQRRKFLLEKYQDSSLVERIMNRLFWKGQTSEQLMDSLGRPVSIDEKVLKTKTKHVWKYNHQGANRYRLRITLEDGRVVGWDQK